MSARLATVFLLARHILSTMFSHVLRSLIVWGALAAALAVVIGIFTFTRSIDDSFQARGTAVGGVSDLQVRAVANGHFKNSLVRDLRKVRGTRLVVAVDEQRIAINSKKRTATVASAFGIDNSARKLRSALQRELNVKTPKNPENGGLTISREMAKTLGVKRGEKVRILSFTRSPEIRIRRVQKVSPALSEVVALPRKSVEQLRGADGPNTLFVQLKPGVTTSQWERRARDTLPKNAEIVTVADQQSQLDRVLSVTTRSYTYLFGAVALLIVFLLVYVLQLMRMIDRQEDAGLVRALGSDIKPLAAAELLTLTLVLVPALPVGVLAGRMFADRLADNLPDYLTQVFNFTMVVEMQSSTVVLAALAILLVAAIATIGALIATRAPVADQLGRSPQSGATAVAMISLRAALLMIAAGLGLLLLAALSTGYKQFVVTALAVMLGISLVTPGLTTLFAHALVRFERGGAALMVARSSVESNPRRVAISAAIMALAVCAVVPLQLLDHGLDQRTKDMTAIHNHETQRIAAADDLYTTVPVRLDVLRKGIKEKKRKIKVEPVVPTPGMTPADVARAQRAAVKKAQEAERKRALPSWAAAFSTGFTTYRGQRVSVMGIDSRRSWPFNKTEKKGKNERSSAELLRDHRNQAVISSELAAWTDLKAGDTIRLRTEDGMRTSRISAVVDDMSWPMGTVYFDNKRHQELFGDDAINALMVKPGKVDRKTLKKNRPLHTYSGADLVERITSQMDKTRSNMLAMRWMIVLAALVALVGILATAVLSRRREWAVLRAVGMSRTKLLVALAIEITVILVIGAVVGAVGGVIAFEGPIIAFLDNQGFTIGREIVALPLLITAVVAIGVGLIAVMLSALSVVRAKLADALAYE